jgi:drug/metabolite transporter (DMT)-like permease
MHGMPRRCATNCWQELRLYDVLCYNRGVELIGANRAAPFFHTIPVFGSVMAIFFLGEQLHLFHLFGYGLVLIGVFVAARKQKAG